MKQFYTFLAAVLLTATSVAQVGINTDSPDPSAALDIVSTTGGLLVPRMKETERDGINPAATGLMIYQTDGTPGFYYYNGTVWTKIGDVADGSYDTLTNNVILNQFNEGQDVIWSLNTTNIPNGTIATLQLYGDAQVDVDYLINGGAPLQFEIQNNFAEFSINITEDYLTEGQEFLQLVLDATDSAGNATGSLSSPLNITDSSQTPVVGDFYGGGVVFYLLGPGDTGYVEGETHGLIAAVQDQSNGIRWYNDYYVTTGAIGTAIGTGSANTTTIINAQGPDATSYAAGLARSYAVGEYIDWFLPSRDELNKMYLKKTDINTTALANGGAIFSSNFYWSSTETDANAASLQYFFDGVLLPTNKNNTYYVRAVRAF